MGFQEAASSISIGPVRNPQTEPISHASGTSTGSFDSNITVVDSQYVHIHSTKPNTALRRDPSKPLPNEQDMRQERAEIQNIVVVRHWSLVDLRRLYELAEKEATQPIQSPPQNLQEAVELLARDPRLSINGPEHDSDLSKAHPKPIELSLSRLDASMKKAVKRPKVLHSPGDDVVDVLLSEWAQLHGFGLQSQHHHKGHRYKASYQTDDDDDDLEPELGRAKGIGGQYIQGPTNGNKRNVKSVHFRARVESGSEGSDNAKQQPKKPPSRHVLRAEASSSSLTSSSASSDFSDLTPPPTPTPRTAQDRGSKDVQSSSSRRYTPPDVPSGNGPEGSNKSERRTPPSPIYFRPMSVQHNQCWQDGGGVGSFASGNQTDFRGGPHSPNQKTRPSPIQNQSWQATNQFSNNNNNNNLPGYPMQQHSQQQHHPNMPHRAASIGGPTIPSLYGSPIPPASLHGGRFHALSHPQLQPPSSLQKKPQANSGGYNSSNNGNNNNNNNNNNNSKNQPLPPSRHRSERRHHRTPREKRGEGGSGRSSGIGSREGKNILTKSLISAGAVAGLLDILDGLGAI